MNEDSKDYFNKAVTEALSQGYERGFREGRAQGYEDALEDFRGRSNARKDDGWTNIPTEEIRAEIGGLQDCITDLEGRLKRIEAVVFYGGKKRT